MRWRVERCTVSETGVPAACPEAQLQVGQRVFKTLETPWCVRWRAERCTFSETGVPAACPEAQLQVGHRVKKNPKTLETPWCVRWRMERCTVSETGVPAACPEAQLQVQSVAGLLFMHRRRHGVHLQSDMAGAAALTCALASSASEGLHRHRDLAEHLISFYAALLKS